MSVLISAYSPLPPNRKVQEEIPETVVSKVENLYTPSLQSVFEVRQLFVPPSPNDSMEFSRRVLIILVVTTE